jgi:anti-sigma factor RsiW
MGGARDEQQRGTVSLRGPAGLSHRAVHSQLTAFQSGDLDSTSAAAVTAHLAQCATCARKLTTLQCTILLLRTLPPRPAPSRLRQRLLALAAEPGGPAGDPDRTPAARSSASCPPHYWLIAGGTHRQQHWRCHRCGQQQEHQQKPLRLLRLQSKTTSSQDN